ncbi:MAG: bifunctional phosphopantothenoylcysteine decarboxylase/phosphopantothenate--cysteine ligase CoaBC [Clostridiales bacterium]|nr:bifunctional phosphopantothenoylcysteine decarboxylase/phosphopantothenate--cysteine ligase CoaBC [Clostridiales bacterium]
MLKGKKIVLCVSGGIAAYKACELTRLYVKNGADVRVAMTKNACQFITPQTFETLTGNRVYTDMFEHAWEINHISLARFADICVVAPATANIIAKLSSGIADEIVSTALLAMNCPVLLAPAMNTNMWLNPATQANVDTLKRRQIHFVGPESGQLACGDIDAGRMSEPSAIYDATVSILKSRHDLAGLKILVTAGPTREMLDPVRFLSNRSSGKMGYAISEAALARGAQVELVSGPVSIPAPHGVRLHNIVSTQDLFETVTSLFEECDVVIQAAAPADYTPKSFSKSKIKKNGTGMTLELESTPDVAKFIGERKRTGQVFVAFAAETDATPEQADKKRISKNADLIVLNDVTKPGAGFAVDTNIVTLIGDGIKHEYPLMSKRDVADAILDAVIALKNNAK